MSWAALVRRHCVGARALARLASCWSCGHAAGAELFCGRCRALQPPPPGADLFRALGVRAAFEQDEAELARRHRALQAQLHPDKFANKSEEEQAVSEQYSAFINEAYSTLLDPLTRGEYMLRVRGHPVAGDGEGAGAGEGAGVDPEFLARVMELNEAVEAAGGEAEVLRLEAEVRAQEQELQRQVAAAFRDGRAAAAAALLARLRYLGSVRAAVRAAARARGIVR